MNIVTRILALALVFSMACRTKKEEVSGPTPGYTPPETSADLLACPEIIACVDQCTAGDATCATSCISRPEDPSAHGAYVAVHQCKKNSGCTDALCFEERCAAELDVCNGNTPSPEPEPEGMSCADWFLCVEPCTEGDTACTGACTSALSDDGRAELDAIEACRARFNCTDVHNNCLETNCDAELRACAE